MNTRPLSYNEGNDNYKIEKRQRDASFEIPTRYEQINEWLNEEALDCKRNLLNCRCHVIMHLIYIAFVHLLVHPLLFNLVMPLNRYIMFNLKVFNSFGI